MEDDISNISKKIQTLKMAEATKSRIRGAIFEHLKANPLPTNRVVSTPSPYFSFFTKRRVVFSSALVLVIFLTSGMAAAAEYSLPGEILYPIKAKLTEPILTQVAVRTKHADEWYLTQAQRRLDEAATLLAKKKLTPETENYLAMRFSEQVNIFYSHSVAKKPATTTASTKAGADLKIESENKLPARFVAKLETYRAVFKQPKQQPTKLLSVIETNLPKSETASEKVAPRPLYVPPVSVVAPILTTSSSTTVETKTTATTSTETSDSKKKTGVTEEADSDQDNEKTNQSDQQDDINDKIDKITNPLIDNLGL